MKRLPRIDGGHAQIEVLRRIASEPVEGAETTLISPHRFTGYCGRFARRIHRARTMGLALEGLDRPAVHGEVSGRCCALTGDLERL
jgi:hypothetical protein